MIKMTHDDANDNVRGTLDILVKSRFVMGNRTHEVKGFASIKINGDVNRSHLEMAPDVQMLSLTIPILSRAQGKGIAQVIKHSTGKSVDFAVGDSFRTQSIKANLESKYYKNGKLIGAEKHDRKTLHARLDKMIGDNRDILILRTLPGTRSKLRMVLNFNGKKTDYQLVKK